ncbi:MAG: VOC family protein [Bacteroidota bacterium]
MKKISIISIPVTDQQRAKEFYLKAGFKLMVETQAGPGQTWIQLGLPGAETSITLVNWFPQMPAGSVRGLVVDTADIEQEIKNMQANGIEPGPIEQTPWGRFATVKDPDGNAFSLHQ